MKSLLIDVLVAGLSRVWRTQEPSHLIDDQPKTISVVVVSDPLRDRKKRITGMETQPSSCQYKIQSQASSTSISVDKGVKEANVEVDSGRTNCWINALVVRLLKASFESIQGRALPPISFSSPFGKGWPITEQLLSTLTKNMVLPIYEQFEAQVTLSESGFAAR